MASDDEWDISQTLIPSGTDTPLNESSEDEHVSKKIKKTISTGSSSKKSKARQENVASEEIGDWTNTEGFDLVHLDGDDESFIAAQQAASNRKSSNLKGRTVRKGGGFQAMGGCSL